MSTDDDDALTRQLAGISRRLQARRDQARHLFETAPELSDLREIKARFNGSVVYVRSETEGWSWGHQLPAGVVPAEAFIVRKRRR